MLTTSARPFGLIGFFLIAGCENASNPGSEASSGPGFIDSDPPPYVTAITLDNGEVLEGPAISVSLVENQGTTINVVAETGDGAGISVRAMDIEFFLEGTWETEIGLRSGLAQAHVGGAVVPAGTVRYDRMEDRITGTVEIDLDTPSNFPSWLEATELGMSFDGKCILACKMAVGEDYWVTDEAFESPFCQQFAQFKPAL